MNESSYYPYIGDITLSLKRVIDRLHEEHDKLWAEYLQLQKEGDYKQAHDVFNRVRGVDKAQSVVLEEWECILHPELRLPKQLEFEGLRVLEGGLK